MATILDLPDECLSMICKQLDSDEQVYRWVNVCRRFRNIYYEYFHNWSEVNDDLVGNFGHLIGTADFPLSIVKRIQLSKSKCTKEFLKKLRKFHSEIEAAKLFSFTDDYLAELLPLPNLKVLICIGTYDLRGRSLIDLCSLEELHIHTNKYFDAENLLQITHYNALRKLVIPNDPQVFANRYAYEMVENLKHLIELVVEYNPCRSWQLIGKLPKLKKLEIWDFVSQLCETCLENGDCYETCSPQHSKYFFEDLRQQNQLEELTFCDGCVCEFHLPRIAELTSLKSLRFMRTSLPHLSLDVFKTLNNLEELYIDGADRIYWRKSLEFIRNCVKLKRVIFWGVQGVTGSFIGKANELLRQRNPQPTEPLVFGFPHHALNLTQLPQECMCLGPNCFIDLVVMQRKYVSAEEQYLKNEEDFVSQTQVQGEFLKRKFSIMNMEAKPKSKMKSKLCHNVFGTPQSIPDDKGLDQIQSSNVLR